MSRRPYISNLGRRIFRLTAACLLVQALPSCVSVPKQQLTVASLPVFDPLVFFSGRTEGRGTLKKLLSSPVPVTVHGHGVLEEGGVLILDQEVLEGEKPPRKRRWRIHRVGESLYTGSLSDADGRVKISVKGNRMHISFTMEGGFPVDQHLFLAEDGQSAENIMVVRKLGMRVAVLNESIERIPE